MSFAISSICLFESDSCIPFFASLSSKSMNSISAEAKKQSFHIYDSENASLSTPKKLNLKRCLCQMLCYTGCPVDCQSGKLSKTRPLDCQTNEFDVITPDEFPYTAPEPSGRLRYTTASDTSDFNLWSKAWVQPYINLFFEKCFSKQSTCLNAWFYKSVAMGVIGTPEFEYMEGDLQHIWHYSII